MLCTEIFKTKKGAALTEYGILAGLVAVVSIGAVGGLGGGIQSNFQAAETSLSSALSQTASAQSGSEEVLPSDGIILEYSNPAIAFGVGPNPGETLTVRWPDGHTETVTSERTVSRNITSGSAPYQVFIEGNAGILGSTGGAVAQTHLTRIVSFGTQANLTSLRLAAFGSSELTSVPPLPATVTTIEAMFHSVTSPSATIAGLGSWNLANVDNMSWLFLGASNFNDPAVSSWNVSNVVLANGVFNGAAAFDQPLDQWNVSGWRDIDWLFNSATSFNQDLTGWDLSNLVEQNSGGPCHNWRGNTPAWEISNQPTNLTPGC